MKSVDSRSQTAVIGELLIAAVVIIVGMTVIFFGFALTDSLNSGGPTADFETTTDPNTGTLQFVPTAGDALPADELVIKKNGKSVPVSDLVSGERIETGTAIPVRPNGADTIRLVWQHDGKSRILHTVESYSASQTFTFVGERTQTFNTTAVETVTVTVSGAGGQPASYSDGAPGGYVKATLDVSEVEELTLYVAESPQATPMNPEGGWGWKDGGAPATGAGNFAGGGGGGATAVVVDGSPVLVVDGGGGGTGWDTYTFYAGGGGARGGDGGPLWYGGSAGDGEGNGDGGDGAGGTTGSDEDSFVAATPGGAEILDASLITDTTVETGEGAASGRDATVRISYEVD